MKRLFTITAVIIWTIGSMNTYAQSQNKSSVIKAGDAQGDTTYQFRSRTSGIVRPAQKPFAYDGYNRAYSNDTTNSRNLNYQNNGVRLLPNYGGIR